MEKALVIYSPDTLRSGLCEAIDQFILSNTDLLLHSRTYRRLSSQQVFDLYEKNNLKSRTAGKLVSTLFRFGPSAISIWKGNLAHKKIGSLKGVSNPFAASSNSIRGRFLCDNKISNLVHSSDSIEDTAQELQALSCDHLILDSAIVENDLALDFRPKLNHNGFYEFMKLLERKHSTRYLSESVEKNLWDMNANELCSELTSVYTLRVSLDDSIAKSGFQRFVKGEKVSLPELSEFVDPWSYFIITCSWNAFDNPYQASDETGSGDAV